MAAQVAHSPRSQCKAKRNQVFRSVFPTESSLPTPQPNPSLPIPGHHTEPSAVLSPVTASFLLAPLTSQRHASGQNAGRDAVKGADEQTTFDRAWQTVTTVLQLPHPTSGQESSGALPSGLPFQSHEDEVAFSTALQVVLQSSHPGTGHDHTILAWHSHQARRHFIQHVEPLLAATSAPAISRRQDEAKSYGDHLVVVENAVHLLEAALQRYFNHFSLILRGIERGDQPRAAARSSETIVTRFRRDLHALISNSAGPIMPSLRVVLDVLTEQALQILPNPEQKHISFQNVRVDEDQVELTRGQLLSLVEALAQVGLAGEGFQGLFAEVMDKKMRVYVRRSYAKVWKTAPANSRGFHGLDKGAAKSMNLTQASWCIVSLCHWVENHFARLALEVRSRTDGSGSKLGTSVPLTELQQWKEVAIGHIAALRISELFDIVLQWPASKGALDDLKASVTTPERRRQLTDYFSAALQKRLLHPARSTLDILRVYISMIRTFHALDHSKVLLSRVVPSLQLYLIQREDAVRIVVTGLLASPEEVEEAQKRTSSPKELGSETGRSGKLVELAMLLNDPDQQRRVEVDDEDLDWDDMKWVPDPVDAGVNYKRPRSEDVIGTVISTLGAEDVFIKEFQTIIADNLLSTQTNFTQEQRVLDLLKKRFGESALQNCEVMIKDIFDSRKVDTMIRMVELGKPALAPRVFGTPAPTTSHVDAGQQLDMDEEEQGLLPYQARILSRLYWPNIVQETFTLPRPVVEQQARYGRGYECLKSARKLTWLHQLGQATVELELEDRTVNVECRTFEAAVIYAFEDGDDGKEDHSGPAHRTVQELHEHLQMDEELVLQALEFWESQQVLARYPHDQDMFVVLERRDQPLGRPELHPAASAPAVMQDDHGAQPGGKPTALKRAGTTSAMDAKEHERRAMYWQFIVGMLTNSMPNAQLGQLAMMMRMLITDGFSWSDQDLQEFLAEKVELGELEVAGGKYKLVKK